MIMSRFRRRMAGSAAAAPGQPQQQAADATKAPSGRSRHAIFYDVENTSSPDDVSRVVALLEVDRSRCDTQLVAVGNWRVIGQETARLLAKQGAELVHSAPSTGVRDWSDLRIAVDAGIWLGSAKPGDMLDVVSDDQAFDAVGDVAATLGVRFRRIPSRERRDRPAPEADRGRGRARTSGGAGEGGGALAAAGSRQASHEDILAFVHRLTPSEPSGQGGVSLDALSNALKDAGFSRAPGSFRLITRLRRMKELRVSPDGMIRFATPEDAAAAESAAAVAVAEPARPRRRRGRRGGRRRGGRHRLERNGSDETSSGDGVSPDTAQ
jgi:hypothetical protein